MLQPIPIIRLHSTQTVLYALRPNATSRPLMMTSTRRCKITIIARRLKSVLCTYLGASADYERRVSEIDGLLTERGRHFQCDCTSWRRAFCGLLLSFSFYLLLHSRGAISKRSLTFNRRTYAAIIYSCDEPLWELNGC